MHDIDARLVRCFSAVFPGVSSEEISAVNLQLLPGWDSLTMVTLATVLQQEFGVEFDFADFESISFSAVHEYLQRGSARRKLRAS